jgi:TetR/AcrR family transcriptional regulator, regulator of cefoperazone and chloramphenicol sensitivity
MRLFAENGFEATSLRAVAAAAGVSPALITHHFGTKKHLQEEVDDEVFGTLRDALSGVDGSLPPNELIVAFGRNSAQIFGADADLRRYLRRALLDNSEAGRALFQRLIQGSRDILNGWRRAGVLREDADEDWAPFQLTLITVGPLLLEPLLGPDAFGDDILHRRSAANQRLLLHGMLIEDRQAIQSYR